jgi:hypothetical protein
VQSGRRIAVDVDLEKFFDRVNHDILIGRLQKRIADAGVIRLIRVYLNSGIMADGVIQERLKGTPQGGPLSPLLANVLLDEVDKELERRGHCFVRYADDANVYVRGRKAGERVMALLRRLYGALRLTVNEAKSAVASVFGRKVLGYSFWVAPGGEVKRRVADKPLNLNPSNRPVRTRMPGGVAGERSERIAPYADRPWKRMDKAQPRFRFPTPFIQSAKFLMRPFLIVLALTLATPQWARAQMALPGAVAAPTPEGEAVAPPPAEHAAPRKRSQSSGLGLAIRPKPPVESAVTGQALSLNGTRGTLLIEKGDGELRVTKLVLPGARISHPNQSCELAMGEDGPIKLKPLGTPLGVQSFELQSSACPLVLDLLGGAFHVGAPPGACTFTQADCRADFEGVWGPGGGSFSDGQIKTFERERAGLERSVQTRFRELLHKFKKKPDLAKALVKDQAAFAAIRSRTCRDYEREEAHGFCALRLTEARDFALQAKLADFTDGKDTKGRKEPKGGKPVKEARKPGVRPGPHRAPPQAPATPPPALH